MVAALVVIAIVCGKGNARTSLLQGFRTSSVGWEGWGPELVINGHLAPEHDIGTWTTIPEPWGKRNIQETKDFAVVHDLHETRPDLRGEEEVSSHDPLSRSHRMAGWFANRTLEENKESFGELLVRASFFMLISGSALFSTLMSDRASTSLYYLS